MRLALLLALLAPPLHATTACNIPFPRQLAGGARLIVVGTATSPTSWRVDEVVHGKASVASEIEAGSAIVGACFDIKPGQKYLVCVRDERINVRRFEDATDDLAFLKSRHFVTRADVLNELGRWSGGRVSTERFHRWIASADTTGVERDQAATVHVIDNLEWITEEIGKLEPLDADLAARFRSGPATAFYASFSRFPDVETEGDLAMRSAAERSWNEVWDSLNAMITAMYESCEWESAAMLVWMNE